MNKITLIIIGIIILAFGGLVTWSVLNSQPSTNVDNYDSTSVISPTVNNGHIGDHVRGDAKSPVVVIEYADFQCPGCATTHPKIDTLYEEYGDRVAFVFRHFTLSGHKNARSAASAAISAGLQGYFFQMAGILYANQAVWSYASGTERTGIFADLFQQIAPDGDVTKFRADISKPEVSQKINFDSDLGSKIDKVSGTPSIHINGEYIKISGSTTTEDVLINLREKIDAQLAKFNLPTGPATKDTK